jgi:hypothetical protein
LKALTVDEDVSLGEVGVYKLGGSGKGLIKVLSRMF